MKNVQWFLGLGTLAFALMSPGPSRAELFVSDAAVTTKIEHLTPKGTTDNFPASVEKLYAFTRITGAKVKESVKHLWFHNDRLVAEVELSVRSRNWRTYSSMTRLPEWKGSWRVDVTTHDGTVIHSIPFTVK